MLTGGDRESVRVFRALLDSYERPSRCDPYRPQRASGFVESMRVQSGVPTFIVRRWLYVALALGVGGFVLGGLKVGLLVIVGGPCMVCLCIWRRALAQRRSIERDLPALLTSVASSVRAGVDPLSALLAAREYFQKESPLIAEVEKIRTGLSEGGDEEELLEEFLSHYASHEGDLFKRCLILSRRHGSSLADPLHRIVKVVRQRQSFRRKIGAALAMHRMSSIGIALCAAAMGTLQLGMNPRAFESALNHPLGGVLLLVGLALIVGGVAWMMLMGREVGVR